jgi:hypothetical protein
MWPTYDNIGKKKKTKMMCFPERTRTIRTYFIFRVGVDGSRRTRSIGTPDFHFSVAEEMEFMTN